MAGIHLATAVRSGDRVAPARILGAYAASSAMAWALFYIAMVTLIEVTIAGSPRITLLTLEYSAYMIGSLIVSFLIVIMIVTAVFIPIYIFLHQIMSISWRVVLPVAFFQGLMVGYAAMSFINDIAGHGGRLSEPFGSTETLVMIILAGLCALIGGIVFCRMTIWHKPSADGVSDVPE